VRPVVGYKYSARNFYLSVGSRLLRLTTLVILWH